MSEFVPGDLVVIAEGSLVCSFTEREHTFLSDYRELALVLRAMPFDPNIFDIDDDVAYLCWVSSQQKLVYVLGWRLSRPTGRQLTAHQVAQE